MAVLAPALAQLRAECNARWPHRSKASDGWLGDAAHAARASDHNPSGGVVHAIDVTVNGIDKGALLREVIGDPRVKYVISDRKIYEAPGFRPQYYSGSNPHVKHVHISVKSGAPQNNRSPWFGGGRPAPAAPARPAVRTQPFGGLTHQGSKGPLVTRVQTRLRQIGAPGVTADGNFGPKSKAAVVGFQRRHKLAADGEVGPRTWAVLFAYGTRY